MLCRFVASKIWIFVHTHNSVKEMSLIDLYGIIRHLTCISSSFLPMSAFTVLSQRLALGVQSRAVKVILKWRQNCSLEIEPFIPDEISNRPVLEKKGFTVLNSLCELSWEMGLML